MRVRSLVVTLVVTAAALGLWGSPAGAVGTAVFAGGDITVSASLGACATVTFPVTTTFAGEFSATGQVQGPGLKAATIRGVLPFANTRGGTTWTGCIPGAYEGATAGWAKYTLVASGLNGGEIVYVVQCAVTNGVVSCV